MNALNTFEAVARPKILALHGRGSNEHVTRMQLENLDLQPSQFDVVYVNGPIVVSEAGPGIASLKGLVSGPWYSWFGHDLAHQENNQQTLLENIVEALSPALKVIAQEGPFDSIFGFSQGAVVADLLIGLPQDAVLKDAVKQRLGEELGDALEYCALMKNAVFACAAAPLSLKDLRARAGLAEQPSLSEGFNKLHLIGRQDDFKAWSESYALGSSDNQSDVLYLAGGHEIGNLQRQDNRVNSKVASCFAVHTIESVTKEMPKQWLQSSKISQRTVAEDSQVATVKVKTEGVAKTFTELLEAQPSDAPLFRLARERDISVLTTYGELLRFYQDGGEGDLRRLRVVANEVVAYIAPPGGDAVAAAAFLSIAAQTCAVPFSASMSQSDAQLALQQFGVKHMIWFDGVAASGVKSAFEQYANAGLAQLHVAEQPSDAKPGLFRFTKSLNGFEQLPPLRHEAQANSLMLRTSGTTSVPKVVPLRQQDLVLNAVVLADSIGLKAVDITYSVMPLDHIGGISATVLASVAAGASITCDGLYNPQGMIEALTDSVPRPTWYSAVPTIHNGTMRYLRDKGQSYLNGNGQWRGHNLRMIRSGAAALKESDRLKLEHVFGCDVVTTYSMSEMMPITQPASNDNGWLQHPGAVGVPVAASMAIVDSETLQPLPFGQRGEVAIAGPSVFEGYKDNPEANAASRFVMKSPGDGRLHHWFLTGDLGQMGEDGTLTLRGRKKDLIKRGGEQVSPAEVEALLTQHAAVNLAVCFSVPSEVYGEEVGCALVLDNAYVGKISRSELVRELRSLLREQGLANYKFPTVWQLAEHEDIPRTSSRKIIRNKMADALGLNQPDKTPEKPQTKAAEKAKSDKHKKSDASKNQDVGDFYGGLGSGVAATEDKPKVDWAALAGLRFVLACYVMFMHIGSNESWGAFNNLRQFPWHVHTFFALAGFSLAIIMPAMINKKLSFISARIAGMYPLYGLAIILAMGNLLVSCNPSTFSAAFSWSPLLSSGEQMFCQGTPLVQDSWWANFLLTFGIHATGLQATPLWGATWFLGFYLWFISMYFQCLIVFPYIYNALYKNRGNTKRLLMYTVLALVVNVAIVMGFWYGYALDATGYGLYDAFTGQRAIPSADQVNMAGQDNAVILGFYLFAPFWMVYFIAGMCAAFVFDSMRPSEQTRAKLWGYVADGITLILLAVSIGHIAQGYVAYGPDVKTVALDPFFMRPEAANSFADPSTVNRIWDNIWGRLFAPLTLLWIFAISTGQGLTAKALRFSPLSQTLAPTAYACFLFHQMVGQWYYAATRHGEWWNWWSDQKVFYWFSPQPVAVEWYEYFYVVGLVVLFAKLVQPLEPWIRKGLGHLVMQIKGLFGKQTTAVEAEDTQTVVVRIVEGVTGMEVQPHWSLEDCGLASLGLVQFTNTLESTFSSDELKISLAVIDIAAAENIAQVATLVEQAIQTAQNTSADSPNSMPQPA